MCFSVLQIPRCKIHTLTNSWRGSLYKLGRDSVSNSSVEVLGSHKYELEGGYCRKWIRRSVNTKTGGKNDTMSSKTSLRHEMSEETSSIKLNTYALETTEQKRSQSYVSQKIADNKDLERLVTIIAFDIETTGFGREKDRVIEIAFQDLRGGKNSTFQTLVNPGRYVPNTNIHGISSNMVNRSDVPSMKQLIPLLLKYIQSRQIPGGVVVLIAHNARTFDVPFLKREFSRCSCEIPPDWLFIDTLPLAHAVMKSKGSKVPSKVSLPALGEYYDIPLVGSAHRALSDVHLLAQVLQRLTHDLKLPISGLLQSSFK
ncbi:exonuclease DPD1, chloroplastic/mitochondrial-like [Olea europaea var. sylvestris]|uniref:exonuclease DPD1, chloroplastic/mitochondrial-like n=1 Tax=Olea europaea var. sylvestris TaxID=158386 RepID=UPI000C1D0562|nr:exonuclease DPD1, chloroplastic/mitochondrial-like [Olea europaea var. sylvestris]XP_022876578.1 exonuclease DPD1, chloroplastic/mitochondrial-like [Olea europaea var. sylvestris]XP_022876579.1 exonuclease DPD1, chloroplastic/mitochondrial-like [Olea europaea var. sylvestris]